MNTEFAPTIRMHHATRAKAARLAAALEAEYPRLSLEAIEGDDIDHEKYEYDLGGFQVLIDGEEVLIETEGKEVPDLADVTDAVIDQEIDLTDEEEEGDEVYGGSVVSAKYRETYREVSSNGQSCGDWLAERLVADTTGTDGKIRIDDLTAIFEANGVDLTAKWAMARHTGTRGWQGRYRMSGRIVLEKAVVLTGVYVDQTGAKVTPHVEWVEAMETKHGKWLAKQRKLAAEAEAGARQLTLA